MHLTSEEEKALEGEYGVALQAAYRVLVSTGKLLKADRLIPIVSAHLSGVNYSNLGDAGLEFLETFSGGAKVKVRTTLNPCGIDLNRTDAFSAPRDFIDKQKRVIESYVRMGVSKTLSCIPYEIDNEPPRGSHVAWAESSACVYGNSVLGIMTNRESAVSALSSAITGKTPHAGLHLMENRRPKVVVEVEEPLESSTDFGILGFFAGKLTPETIGFTKLRGDKPQLKALSAAIGTSGASGMFVLLDSVPKGTERVSFTRAEHQEVKAQLSSQVDPEVLLLGCPFYTVEEVAHLASRLRGRKLKKPTYVHLSRSVYSAAKKEGMVDWMEGAGAVVLKDMCPSLTPTPKWMGFTKVATDSPKGSYYMSSALRLRVSLLSTEEIIDSYT